MIGWHSSKVDWSALSFSSHCETSQLSHSLELGASAGGCRTYLDVQLFCPPELGPAGFAPSLLTVQITQHSHRMVNVEDISRFSTETFTGTHGRSPGHSSLPWSINTGQKAELGLYSHSLYRLKYWPPVHCVWPCIVAGGHGMLAAYVLMEHKASLCSWVFWASGKPRPMEMDFGCLSLPKDSMSNSKW